MNSPYQKHLLLFILLMTFSFTKAQTIEEEISKKSCECINLKLTETNTISKEEINTCIGESLDIVLKSKSEKEAKRYMRNMNAFVEKARTIYKSVSENCLSKTGSQ